MTITRQHIEATMEAQRFAASQASREVAELDVLSVWFTVKAKIEAGEIEAAKAIVKAYREGK